MKLTSESKSVPTFKQYVKSGDATIPSDHPVECILWSDEWRTITFYTDEFKMNYKVADLDELGKVLKNIRKTIGKACKCSLQIESETVCHFNLVLASDADEQWMEYEETDRGWNRTH